MEKITLPDAKGLAEMYANAIPPWKRKAKKRKLKFCGVFISPIKFSDTDEFLIFDCECRDYDHLLFNVKLYMAQGLHPLAIRMDNVYLTHSKLDQLKKETIMGFTRGSISQQKSLLRVPPSLQSIKLAFKQYEKINL